MKPLAPGSGSMEFSECLKISFEFVLTRSTAEGVGGSTVLADQWYGHIHRKECQVASRQVASQRLQPAQNTNNKYAYKSWLTQALKISSRGEQSTRIEFTHNTDRAICQ